MCKDLQKIVIGLRNTESSESNKTNTKRKNLLRMYNG